MFLSENAITTTMDFINWWQAKHIAECLHACRLAVSLVFQFPVWNRGYRVAVCILIWHIKAMIGRGYFYYACTFMIIRGPIELLKGWGFVDILSTSCGFFLVNPFYIRGCFQTNYPNPILNVALCDLGATIRREWKSASRFIHFISTLCCDIWMIHLSEMWHFIS